MTYPMFGKDWRCRWLVLKSWSRLHRVAQISWDSDEHISGKGRTACGRSGRLTMPGVLSRIGLQRCGHCCRATGTPKGYGNPYNEDARVNEHGGMILEIYDDA